MIAKLLGGILRLYQKYISPQLPRHCRYYPTCSAYAYEAIAKHGALKGLLLGIWRVLRCNPFSRGGYDPVPETFTFRPYQAEDDEEDDDDITLAAEH